MSDAARRSLGGKIYVKICAGQYRSHNKKLLSFGNLPVKLYQFRLTDESSSGSSIWLSRRYQRAEVNALANFAFLTKETNLRVSNISPEVYLPEYALKQPGALESHWIPMDPQLWTIDKYPEFLEARKELFRDGASSLVHVILRSRIGSTGRPPSSMSLTSATGKRFLRSVLFWGFRLSSSSGGGYDCPKCGQQMLRGDTFPEAPESSESSQERFGLEKKLIFFCLILTLLCSSTLANPFLANAVRLEDRKVGKHYKVIAHNSSPLMVSVRVEATLENMSADPPFPRLVVCPPNGSVEVSEVQRLRFEEAWRYSTTFRSRVGDALATHDPQTVYRLPYGKGSSYRIIQGANGSFSHFGENRYAVDFDTPENTLILASRGGTVARPQNSSKATPTKLRKSLSKDIDHKSPDSRTLAPSRHLLGS